MGAVTTSAAADKKVSEADKIKQTDAHYQRYPKGPQRCQICLQFVPPDKCKIVQGIRRNNLDDLIAFCGLYSSARSTDRSTRAITSAGNGPASAAATHSASSVAVFDAQHQCVDRKRQRVAMRQEGGGHTELGR